MKWFTSWGYITCGAGALICVAVLVIGYNTIAGRVIIGGVTGVIILLRGLYNLRTNKA